MSLTLDDVSLQQLREKVAWLYYLYGQSQKEIADRLRFSRTRVCRLLQVTIEQGIVEIRINQTTSAN